MALEQLQTLVLVVVRVGCIFAFLPLLGEGRGPMAVKALASLAIAVALMPGVDARLPVNSWFPVQYLLFVGAEVLFGILMGLSAAIIFGGIRTAGELIGRQIGMALAITADPNSGVQATPIGNYCEVVGALVFFSLGGHHMMLRAMAASFETWPLGAFLSPEFVKTVGIGAASEALLIAFQLAAPLLVLTFLMSLVMALMARLVTEINILVLSFPLRIGVGLVGLAIFLPVFASYGAGVFRTMERAMSLVASGGG